MLGRAWRLFSGKAVPKPPPAISRGRDPLLWMHELQDKRVSRYISQENRYYKAHKFSKNIQAIYRELLLRADEAHTAYPDNFHGYAYYNKTVEGEDFDIYCRKRLEGGHEEVLLDKNRLAEENGFVNVGLCNVSYDGTKMLVVVDLLGDERYVGRLYDLETKSMKEILPNAHSAQLSKDGRVVMYTKQDDLGLPKSVYLHTIGSSSDDDVLIYKTDDPSTLCFVSCTKDWEFFRVDVSTRSSGEVLLIPSNTPMVEPIVVPKQDHLDCVEHHKGGKLLLVSNGKPSKVQITSTEALSGPRQDLVVCDASTTLLDMDVFESFLVLYEQRAGLRRIRVVSMKEEDGEHFVPILESTTSVTPAANKEFESTVVYFSTSHPIQGNQTFQYDMQARKLAVLDNDPPIGVDVNDYTCDQEWVTSHDGTFVPMTVLRNNRTASSNPPVLLKGYGAYGIPLEVDFCPSRFALLDRDWVIAFAHTRGGSEMGLQWYEDGKMMKKRNSIFDFVACGSYFHDKGSKLTAYGQSAGGLLVGAAIQEKPEIFSGAVLRAPFLDVLGAMTDDQLSLTALEYDEWGNPANSSVFEYMTTYSPYPPKERQYPPMMLSAAVNDVRVEYWHALKFVAALRNQGDGNGQVILEVEDEGGHEGMGGQYGGKWVDATEYAFLLDCVEE